MARPPSSSRARIIHVGLGEIGLGVVQALVARNATGTSQLVGVVDANPALAGQRLREIMTGAGIPSLTIDGSVAAAVKRLKGSVDVAAVGLDAEAAFEMGQGGRGVGKAGLGDEAGHRRLRGFEVMAPPWATGAKSVIGRNAKVR